MQGKNGSAKRVTKTVILAMLVIGMGLGGCQGSNDAQTRELPQEKARAEVVVNAVKQGAIFKAFRAVGNVAPQDYARIIPKVSGRIAHIAAAEGDKVQKGQVLLQIDTFDYEWNFQNASALAKQAEANMNMRKRDFARMEKLHTTKAISDQAFQDAKTVYEVSRFTYDQAVAGLKIARRNLRECTVTAPIAGVVTEKFVNEGELVSPQVVAFVVMQMDEVKVEVDLPEEAYGYIAVGNQSHITVDAIPDESFTGTITKLYPTIDPASRTFKVTVTLKNPQLRLRSGMTARAEVIQKARGEAAYAPSGAFVPGEKGYFVYKVESGKVNKVEVSVGIEGDEVFEILSGIGPGDLVVVEGLTGLRDGMAVKVTNEALVRQKEESEGPGAPPATPSTDDTSGIAAHTILNVTAKD